jgi:glycosyltransferase involved in cell wall biosynthesis
MKKEFILIGADPSGIRDSNPGGQLTASIGLAIFANNNNMQLRIINTLQTSFPVPPFRTRVYKGLLRIVILIKLLVNNKIQGVIIFSSSGVSFLERSIQALICRMSGVGTVLFMRDGFFIKSIQESKAQRLVAKVLLKIPRLIGSQGGQWNNVYSELGVPDDRVVQIPNWMPGNSPVANKPIALNNKEKLRFVFVGWLVKEKGVREILLSIQDLSINFDFDFVFVGGGTLENHVNSYIYKNKFDNVVCKGWLGPDKVFKELSKSHVLVLPSYAEGFPNVVLEAMSLGLPCICTDVGGISGSIHNDVNGFLVNVKDWRHLNDAMKIYLTKSEKIYQHSKNTLIMVKKNHDWNVNCGKLFDSFD